MIVDPVSDTSNLKVVKFKSAALTAEQKQHFESNVANSKPYLKDIGMMKNELSKAHWYIGSLDSRNPKGLTSMNQVQFKSTHAPIQNSKNFI